MGAALKVRVAQREPGAADMQDQPCPVGVGERTVQAEKQEPGGYIPAFDSNRRLIDPVAVRAVDDYSVGQATHPVTVP